MFVTVNGQRLFFDVVGEKLAIDGPRMREKPTLIVMHGGPGFDHSAMRPDFDRLRRHRAGALLRSSRQRPQLALADPSTWTLAQWGDDVTGTLRCARHREAHRLRSIVRRHGRAVLRDAASLITRAPSSFPRPPRKAWTWQASLDVFEKKGGAGRARHRASLLERRHRRAIRRLHEERHAALQHRRRAPAATTRAPAQSCGARSIVISRCRAASCCRWISEAHYVRVAAPALVWPAPRIRSPRRIWRREIASSLPPGARLESLRPIAVMARFATIRRARFSRCTRIYSQDMTP
jgi:hypothetical protein